MCNGLVLSRALGLLQSVLFVLHASSHGDLREWCCFRCRFWCRFAVSHVALSVPFLLVVLRYRGCHGLVYVPGISLVYVLLNESCVYGMV